VCLGRSRQAAAGEWPSSRTPLGYLRGPDGRLAVDAAEIPMATRIFEEYVSGASMSAISVKLGSDGAVSRRGVPFSPSAIRAIVSNPIYRGREVIMGHERQRPELVFLPPAILAGADQRLQGRRAKPDPTHRELAIAQVFDAYGEFHETEPGGIAFDGTAKKHRPRSTR
jgi:hypothetical protein